MNKSWPNCWGISHLAHSRSDVIHMASLVSVRGAFPRVLGWMHKCGSKSTTLSHIGETVKAKVHQLQSKFKNTKRTSRSIYEYLLRIKAIIYSVTTIGDFVYKQDHTYEALDGLPEEYNSFVVMIYNRLDSPSIDDIEPLHLMQEAQFEKFHRELVTPTTSTNFAHACQQHWAQ